MLRISHPLSKDEILIVFDLLFFEKKEEKKNNIGRRFIAFVPSIEKCVESCHKYLYREKLMVKILYKFILARGEWKKLCVIYSQSNRDHRTCFKGRETRDAAFANLPPSVGATYSVYTPRVVVLVPPVFDATVQVLVIRYYYQLILEVRLHRGYLVTLDPANRIWPDPTPRCVLHFRTLHPLPFIFASIFLTTEIPARRGSHAASSPAPSSFLPPSNRNTRLKHRHMTSPLLRIVRFISNIPIAKHRERTDFDHDTSYARESIFCNFCPNSPL